jgi:hypothetical protein
VIGAGPPALAGPCTWPYLNGMARLVSASQEIVSVSPPSGGVRSAVVWGGTALGGVALLGALTLWFHYGTAVFFEMLTSGISACF